MVAEGVVLDSVTICAPPCDGRVDTEGAATWICPDAIGAALLLPLPQAHKPVIQISETSVAVAFLRIGFPHCR